MGTYLRVLSKSYPVNITTTGLRWFSKKSLCPCALNERNLSIRRVNPYAAAVNLANSKWYKKAEKWLNLGTPVLIWEHSARAIQWIPTWQGLDDFRKSLHPVLVLWIKASAFEGLKRKHEWVKLKALIYAKYNTNHVYRISLWCRKSLQVITCFVEDWELGSKRSG